MKAYNSLHVFPDVSPALALLREKKELVDAYIFSNGTDEMVGNSVKLSADLGPHADIFRALVTVDALQVFKPDQRVYDHLAKAVGREGNKSDIWLVTSK
jgi:2-haloacid dehalogenase